MKKDLIISNIFSILIFVVTFFNLFVPNTDVQKYGLIIFLIIYTIIMKFFFKDKRVDHKNKKSVTLTIVVLSTVYILILYIIGLFSSFFKNTTILGIDSFLKRILPYIVMVICSEIIRKAFVTRERKKDIVFVTLALIIAEVTLYLDVYVAWDLSEIMALVGYVTFSAISTNLLMNYLVKKYEIMPNIIYRIITTIYIYIFPLLPNIHLYFQAIYRILYPYIIYLAIDNMYEINNFKLAKNSKKAKIIPFIINFLVIFGIAMLISCNFKYGILVVGSSSMVGSIDKGDVVFFEQYSDQTLKKDDVIIFIADDIKVIHRIINIQKKNGDVVYYTKGDNNEKQDDDYRIDEDIKGVVKFKIPKIGWPTLWLNATFEK